MTSQLTGRIPAEQHGQVDGEDLVELPAVELRVVQGGLLEGGQPGGFERRVASPRRGDHLRRAVDREDAAAAQPLAHQGHGHAVPAARFEQPVVRLDR